MGEDRQDAWGDENRDCHRRIMKKSTSDVLRGLLTATKAVTGIVLLLLVGTLWAIFRLTSDRPKVADVAPAEVSATTASITTPPEAAPIVSEPEIVDGKDVATGLLDGEGLSMVKANCLACHSAKLVIQNRFTREGWHEKIVWMQETQGLWDLGENEPVILDYLAEHYAPEERASRRQPLTGIEWYELNE